MNGSSYAQCATPQYLKPVQFSSVNREHLNREPELLITVYKLLANFILPLF
jgi:hypothetical protein